MPHIKEIWPIRKFIEPQEPKRQQPRQPEGNFGMAWNEKKKNAAGEVGKFRKYCRMTEDQKPDKVDQDLIVIMLAGLTTAQDFQSRRYMPAVTRSDLAEASLSYAQELAAFEASKVGRETPAYLDAVNNAARALDSVSSVDTHNASDVIFLYRTRLIGPIVAMKLARQNL
ncbi:hypothetical protein HY024_03545 [Candidatus Curtissbacteria bacterium]|nr:hypothetical protein [Candidatus Curtissbacteria bacterium]